MANIGEHDALQNKLWDWTIGKIPERLFEVVAGVAFAGLLTTLTIDWYRNKDIIEPIITVSEAEGYTPRQPVNPYSGPGTRAVTPPLNENYIAKLQRSFSDSLYTLEEGDTFFDKSRKPGIAKRHWYAEYERRVISDNDLQSLALRTERMIDYCKEQGKDPHNMTAGDKIDLLPDGYDSLNEK